MVGQESTSMTNWFARAVFHVKDVEVSRRFYLERLGFTSPWHYDEGGRVRIAQVERQGSALILTDMWPEKIGKALLFVSMDGDAETQTATLDGLRAELESRGAAVKDGTWGYRLLVVDDPDGNQLYFNYPADSRAAKPEE